MKQYQQYEYLLFTVQSSGENINLLKTEVEKHEAAQCCHTHMYISTRNLEIHIIS